MSDVGQPLTRSQLFGKVKREKAVGSGKVGAADVATLVMAALPSNQLYVYSGPQGLGSVRTRMDDVLAGRNSSDLFHERPDMGASLRAALRGVGLRPDLVLGLARSGQSGRDLASRG